MTPLCQTYLRTRLLVTAFDLSFSTAQETLLTTMAYERSVDNIFLNAPQRRSAYFLDVPNFPVKGKNSPLDLLHTAIVSYTHTLSWRTVKTPRTLSYAILKLTYYSI